MSSEVEGEKLAFIFDRPEIDRRGVDFAAAAGVAEAFRLLCEHAVKFRAVGDPVRGSVGTLSRTFDILICARPETGSLKLPVWALAAVGVIGFASDVSTVSGFAVRDALTAIRGTDDDGTRGDEVTSRFISDRQTQSKVDILVKSAVLTKCTYVAIEYGNDIIVIHGGPEARFSLLASETTTHFQRTPFTGTQVVGPALEVAEVFYQGKPYKSFVVTGAGHVSDPGVDRGMEHANKGGRAPSAVLVWGSQLDIPKNGETFTVEADKIDPSTVTHGPALPQMFRHASEVFFIKRASRNQFQ